LIRVCGPDVELRFPLVTEAATCVVALLGTDSVGSQAVAGCGNAAVTAWPARDADGTRLQAWIGWAD